METNYFDLFIMMALAILILRSSPKGNKRNLQLRRVEDKLDLILSHLDLTYEKDQTLKRAEDLVRSGKPIDAIKLIREEKGVGLKAAKEIVEDIKNELPVVF